MKYQLSKHIVSQASAKNIPLPVVNTILMGKADTMFVSVNHDNCTKCGVKKTRMTGVVNYNKTRYAIDVVVCDKCNLAITVHLSNYSVRTPIRIDQNITHYECDCPDCGKSFRVTARTWEKFIEQTTHKCKGGKRVDLVADEHKGLTGKYALPKEVK